MSDHMSRFQLVRVVTGDATPDELSQSEAHLRGCAECQAVADEVRTNVAEYDESRERHFAQLLSRLPASPLRPARPAMWRWLVPVFAAAAGAGIFLVIARPDPGTPDIAYKGELAMRVVAKRGERQFVVRGGQTLLEGDALRFVVTVASAGHITVFSVDARGTVTPFYPQSGAARDPAPLELRRAGEHELPDAIELDDAEGEEVIVAIFSASPFSRAAVHEAVRHQIREGVHPIRAGAGRDVSTLRFVKAVQGAP